MSVICDIQKIDNKCCLVDPDFVVEVLSPDNIAKEMQFKYEVYEESGVKEYWMVFVESKSIQVHLLRPGKFVALPLFTLGQMKTTPILLGFELHLSKLFLQ